MENKKNILSATSIKALNEFMIGRGAPVEKDGVGYNRPDFQLMYLIGMLNVDYSTEECYLVSKTLLGYKNTQLSEYSELLEETYKHYETMMLEKLSALQITKDFEKEVADCNVHSRSDFEKKTIKAVIDRMEGDVKFTFDEWVNVTPKDYGGRWIGRVCSIPFEGLIKFLADIREVGSIGFKADNELAKFVANELPGILARKKDERNQKMKSLVLKEAVKRDSFGNYNAELNINDKEMNTYLWSLKDISIVSYVNTRDFADKVIISCKPNKVQKLVEVLKDKGVATEGINVGELTFNNKSNNALVDISKLTLPFAPYEYQLKDAADIVSHKRMLVGHEMGCGKTFIAVLVGMSINEKKLVVCPESLRLNWVREIQNVDQTAEISLVYSKDKDWKFGDWTVMGYKTATKFKPEILAAGIKCVFLDEAHLCKGVNNYGNPSTKRAEAMMEITEKAEYVYPMTGTPMPTRNKDLYNELKMLKCPQLENVSFAAYGKEFCDGYNTGFGWDFSGNSHNKELHAILRPLMVRRLKKDVLPNLKKQRQFLRINGVSRDYKAIEKNLHNCEDDETYMGLAMKGRRILSALKVDTAIDFVDSLLDAGESVVVVSEFNDTLDALFAHYQDEACVIKGGISDAKKQQAIDDFQSGAKKVCLLNTIAGGVGITLTRAHNMVILDYDWTPANMVQVEDRICRTGQTEFCNIFYIFNEDALLDKIFMDMITDKSTTIDRVIDDSKNTVDLSAGKKHNCSYLEILKERVRAGK